MTKEKAQLSLRFYGVRKLGPVHWLREADLNHRPSGYEPDELPDCSIPRYLCPPLGCFTNIAQGGGVVKSFLYDRSRPSPRRCRDAGPVVRRACLVCALCLLSPGTFSGIPPRRRRRSRPGASRPGRRRPAGAPPPGSCPGSPTRTGPAGRPAPP